VVRKPQEPAVTPSVVVSDVGFAWLTRWLRLDAALDEIDPL
jgi:hypothetical protein